MVVLWNFQEIFLEIYCRKYKDYKEYSVYVCEWCSPSKKKKKISSLLIWVCVKEALWLWRLTHTTLSPKDNIIFYIIFNFILYLTSAHTDTRLPSAKMEKRFPFSYFVNWKFESWSELRWQCAFLKKKCLNERTFWTHT